MSDNTQMFALLLWTMFGSLTVGFFIGLILGGRYDDVTDGD